MISLIGAPCDAGANRPGAAQGPQALRAAGLLLLRSRGLDVRDRGDLTGPAHPGLPVAGGYRHLSEVVAWNTTVYEAVHSELQRGHLPILLGGDHSLAIGSISAVARHCRDGGKTLRILWLDAHADCNNRRTSPSGNLHGMPVACLCGFGPPTRTGLSGQTPAISPASLRQIGIRSVDEGEVKFCMNMIAQTGRLASLDVVELNPSLDEHQVTAEISVAMIRALLGSVHPSQGREMPSQ